MLIQSFTHTCTCTHTWTGSITTFQRDEMGSFRPIGTETNLWLPGQFLLRIKTIKAG